MYAFDTMIASAIILSAIICKHEITCSFIIAFLKKRLSP